MAYMNINYVSEWGAKNNLPQTNNIMQIFSDICEIYVCHIYFDKKFGKIVNIFSNDLSFLCVRQVIWD